MGGLLARGQGGGPPPWGELGGGACDFASPHATHLAKSDGTKAHETGMVWACLVSIGRSIQALAEKWPGHLRILGPQNHPFPPTTGSKLNGFTRDLDHAPCNGVGMPTINFGANRTSWEQAAGPLPPQDTQKVPKSPLFHTYLSPNSMDSHGTLTYGVPMMHGSLLCRTSPGGGRTCALGPEKPQKLHLSFLLGGGPQHSGQGKISDGQFLCHPRRSISPF